MPTAEAQASVQGSFCIIQHSKRNTGEPGKGVTVGMMAWKSSVFHSWNFTGTNGHLNTDEGDQGETPWKAELIQNLMDRVENLPVTSASTVCKALIFHYKCGWVSLYFVISYLILWSDKAPNIWVLMNSSFSFSLSNLSIPSTFENIFIPKHKDDSELN